MDETTPASASAPDPDARSRRSGRAWAWAAGALVVLLVLSSCVWSAWILFSADEFDLGGGDAVAVIPIDAEIMGVGGGDGFSGGPVTPEAVIGKLRRAEEDDSVKAVLLRIDSPGGTASASHEIATEVARMKKPVVSSIGDVGASGAYMIASQSDEIVATPVSAVGSIGVILTVPEISDLADKLGVKMRIFKKGRYKDAGTPFRGLTPSETAMIDEDLQLVYDEFIDIVAEGRDMDRDEVVELATGWAWSGSRAKELGLVDTMGNYRDAVRRAAKRGGIDGEPEIVTYEEESVLDLLGGLPAVLEQLAPKGLDGRYGQPLAR